MAYTHILLSFGGIDGGFEFTWQLRNDLMQHYHRNPFQAGSADAFFAYLDAVSLMGWHGSFYNWNSEIYCYKFSNENWKKYYDVATAQCQYMVFVLTKPWFDSQWCWGEYDEFRKSSKAKPIFIIFSDAKTILDQGGTYNDRINQGHDVGALKTYIDQNTKIAITSPPIPEIATVSIQGTDYQYHYKYACSSDELAEIMSYFAPL
jgi:hypothetical protein